MMFGAKTRKIRELSDEINRLHSKSMKLTQTKADLRRTIREMDQLIFNMSQCSEWKFMQPYFAKLSAGMMTRKTAESARIGNLIEAELDTM